MVYVYSLKNDDIVGEKFETFIGYLFKNSTHFTLSFLHYEKNKASKFYQDLHEHHCLHLSTFDWFCSKRCTTPNDVMVFNSNDCSRDKLLKHTNRLCALNRGIQDICFFAERGIVFGSISHAHIAKLFLHSQESIEVFYNFADWAEEKFPEKQCLEREYIIGEVYFSPQWRQYIDSLKIEP